MAHRKYLIHYPNGFKRHVSQQELAALTGLTPIGRREYRAASLVENLHEATGPHVLPGHFIVIDSKGKKHKDLLITARGMVERLEKAGVILQAQE